MGKAETEKTTGHGRQHFPREKTDVGLSGLAETEKIKKKQSCKGHGLIFFLETDGLMLSTEKTDAGRPQGTGWTKKKWIEILSH